MSEPSKPSQQGRDPSGPSTPTPRVRDLRAKDEQAVRRILSSSEYIYAHLESGELREALDRGTAVGAFSVPPGPLGRTLGGSLQAFMLVNWLVPPSAWIGAYGVTWSEGRAFERYLDLLFPALEERAAARGARMLYYSGSTFGDWLGDSLIARGFQVVSRLRSYDKADFMVPSEGNTAVKVRPMMNADLPALLSIEQLAFPQLWRHSAETFAEVAARYPYFVVAEDAQGICGYQFNTLEGPTGYLVRIAIHPRVEGQGVGTRLMAEAVRYFERACVHSIALNTEEGNTRAHALYERFGFFRVEPGGFILGRAIATPPRS